MLGMIASLPEKLRSSPSEAQPEPTELADRPLAPAEDESDDVFMFPATAAQRRFWLLDQLVPGGNAELNMPLAARLTGRLDRAALSRSFNEIVRRHEVLRTMFQCERGQLRQLVAPRLSVSIPFVDVRDFPAEERARLPAYLAAEEVQRPFDLAHGPVIRARLVGIAAEEHLLLITVHHIVTDGWSNGVLLRELGEIYTAFVRGQPSPLPELPIQFADYCQWQLDQATDTAGQMAYWAQTLAGELPVLDLPTDRPRRSGRGHAPKGGARHRVLPAELVQSLKALAVREGVSNYMFFLAVFQVLLSRFSGGQEDFIVSTPSANRDRREVEPLIGPFVNPLLLRADLSGDPTFAELLGRVRRIVLGAFEHASVPFEKLIEEFPPRRLQVNFLHQTHFLRPARLPDLELTPVEASGGALFEWTAAVVEEGARTKFSIVYNADLFDATTIDRVIEAYESLLDAVAAPGGLQTPISQLPVEAAAAPAAATRLLVNRWRVPATSARWLDRCCDAGTAESAAARPGIELLVLDRRARQAPVGVTGEICVRGSLEDTNGNWAPEVLTDPQGGRLLKTGDLGRRTAVGSVEWLGRAEDQRNVHGLPVKTGEIEAALRAHPQIRQAVALWEDGSPGQRRLIAFVQSAGAQPDLFDAGRLRDFLRETLAEETIPAAFIPVEHFPMTADDRLDAAALLKLAARPAAATRTREPIPYLTIHYQLIDLWQQLLGVSHVGITDDFFALGGNSLLAMRLLYRIDQVFGKALLPVTLFQHPTIEHLADEMLKNEAGQAAGAVVRLNEYGTKTPIFYLHGDFHGGGFYSMKLSRRLGTDQPFYALPHAELTDPSIPTTIPELAARQVAAIREVRPHGPYVIGGFCLGGLVAYEVAQQLTAAGEVVERLLIIDAGLKNRRLWRMRRAVELVGRQRGLSADRLLYLFCRWHFLLARLERWRGLTWREKIAIAGRRLGGLWQRVRARLLAGRAASASGSALGASPGETEWFDPRWDVPLVYLWSAGGYSPIPYPGPTTVLLSRDLFRGTEHRGLRNWKKYLPVLDVQELPGSHLACITEHVDTLAETIASCLKSEPVKG
jgi:thioesterase domain-containing protein